MVFGDGVTAERAVARLNGVHRGVSGVIADPEARRATGEGSYRALDPELLLWVQATLVISSVRAYRAWVGSLDAPACERFWLEARGVGTRLGIPVDASPATWPQLEAWFEEKLRPGGPIVVTPTVRALAPAIIRPPLPQLPGLAVDLAALPGLALLPPRVRADFGIEWTPSRERLARAFGTGLRSWVTVVPRAWRSMPQARAADRRVPDGRVGRVRSPGAGSVRPRSRRSSTSPRPRRAHVNA